MGSILEKQDPRHVTQSHISSYFSCVFLLLFSLRFSFLFFNFFCSFLFSLPPFLSVFLKYFLFFCCFFPLSHFFSSCFSSSFSFFCSCLFCSSFDWVEAEYFLEAMVRLCDHVRVVSDAACMRSCARDCCQCLGPFRVRVLAAAYPAALPSHHSVLLVLYCPVPSI